MLEPLLIGMRAVQLIYVLLIMSLLYSLCFGRSASTSKASYCTHDFFNSTDKEKKYSYIYSSMFLGCKQKSDRQHNDYMPYFNNTGTGHLLCIAGLHIGSLVLVSFVLVTSLLYLLVPSFKRKGIPYFWFSLPIGIIASILYVYLIGPEIPRVRAVIMLCFGVLSFFVPLFRNKMLVLCVTATIILFVMPASIYTYSFYYSFIAVSGILLASKKEALYICMGIYLFLLPLNLHNSGSFDVSNILANFIVIPFFSLAYYPLNIALVLLFFMGVHSVINIMNASTDVLIFLLKTLSHVSELTKIHTFNISTTETVILYAILLLFFFGIKYAKTLRRGNVILVYLAVALIATYSTFYIYFEYRNTNSVTNFEIQKPGMSNGSGDMILVTTNNKVIMVDTGFGGVSSQRVIREIKRRKIDKIDYLIITHVDTDHAGGLEDVFGQFDVGKIVISPYEYEHVAMNSKLRGAQIILACEGSELNLGYPGKIYFYHPLCGRYLKKHNEAVLSFLLPVGHSNFMFNSDLPSKENELMIQRYKLNEVPLVYQMPHHCNKKDNQAELLNWVHPKLGFCTRDKHLLKKSILEQSSFNFPIFMTGVCGNIDIRVENSGLEVFSEKCSKLLLQLK
ncbi:MAG: ComEC/Rec2 family competence protein [bacterium]